jgi:hypothetical protein
MRLDTGFPAALSSLAMVLVWPTRRAGTGVGDAGGGGLVDAVGAGLVERVGVGEGVPGDGEAVGAGEVVGAGPSGGSPIWMSALVADARGLPRES